MNDHLRVPERSPVEVRDPETVRTQFGKVSIVLAVKDATDAEWRLFSVLSGYGIEAARLGTQSGSVIVNVLMDEEGKRKLLENFLTGKFAEASMADVIFHAADSSEEIHNLKYNKSIFDGSRVHALMIVRKFAPHSFRDAFLAEESDVLAEDAMSDAFFKLFGSTGRPFSVVHCFQGSVHRNFQQHVKLHKREVRLEDASPLAEPIDSEDPLRLLLLAELRQTVLEGINRVREEFGDIYATMLDEYLTGWSVLELANEHALRELSGEQAISEEPRRSALLGRLKLRTTATFRRALDRLRSEVAAYLGPDNAPSPGESGFRVI